MIIGPQNRIVSVEAFVAGLQRAAKGVIRLSSEKADEAPVPLASAWLITDSLAVTPRYALSGEKDREYHVRPTSASAEPTGIELKSTTSIRAQVVDPASPNAPPDEAVLLRLDRPMSGCAQILETDSALADDKMFLLHYPEGTNSLQVSVGRFLSATSSVLEYDADSVGGSSGGAIFSENGWEVLGMHGGRGESGNINVGKPLALILEQLRASAAWPEIADHHKLASPSADEPPAVTTPQAAGLGDPATPAKKLATATAAIAPEPELLAAAVRWTFDPTALGGWERFTTLVIEPDETMPQWVLQDDERRRILQGQSLARLRKARGKEKTTDPGQKVIDRILKGPPYRLSTIKEEDLPYWLQAVRWFEGVAPKLPSVATINRDLGRRRIRGDLRVLTKDKIRGRQKELADLEAWFKDLKKGPMIISGLGGIGKSTLVSQFVLDQPESMPLLWLDFDRADLAPDNALSILKVISDQLAIQLKDFTAPPLSARAAPESGDTWKVAAETIGKQLKAQTRGKRALMVLDGFEIAQHRERYDEIWGVLDVILKLAPRVRVIVSGRARVHGLQLGGKAASELPLAGMAEKEAKAWLRQCGIKDAKTRDHVWKNSRNGVPLVLKLALRLIDLGGAEDLANTLPQRLVEGFLYQRILNRVVNARLKPLAKDVLVLRNVTEEMVAAILADCLPEGMDAQTAFAQLSREMSVINLAAAGGAALAPQASAAGALQIRPEVRSASLRLLELDNPQRVREIDQRAAVWYEKQDLSVASNAAELIYHYLRLGRVQDADKLWRPDYANLLKYAEDELAESAEAARQWLAGKVSESEGSIEAWEQEALSRIHVYLRRGLVRSLSHVLSERADRSAQSPLVFYDAWAAWQNGQSANAQRILDAATPGKGDIQRNRTLLAALIAAQGEKRLVADKLLAEIYEAQWDIPEERLAVLAARVRLTVDIDKELDVAEHLRSVKNDPRVTRYLAPCDVIFSELSKLLGRQSRTDSTILKVPRSDSDLRQFTKDLQWARVESSYKAADSVRKYWIPRISMSERVPQAFKGGKMTASKQLFHLARQRWALASNSLFVHDACELLAFSRNSLAPSIVASLVPFRGIDLGIRGSRNLDEIIWYAAFRMWLQPAQRLSEDTEQRIRRIAPLLPATEQWLVRKLEWAAFEEKCLEPSLFRDLLVGAKMKASPFFSLVVLLMSPDPLVLLCERVAGLPAATR